MRLFTTIATMLLLSITLSFAGTVRGVIKDAQTKEPLIGANVQLSGTIIGATTDEDGAFVLTDVKSGNYTLDVTYLGYSSYSTIYFLGRLININYYKSIYSYLIRLSLGFWGFE